MTRGGVSKASRGINLSEDIYAGFNHLLRGGTIPYIEYVQVRQAAGRRHAAEHSLLELEPLTPSQRLRYKSAASNRPPLQIQWDGRFP